MLCSGLMLFCQRFCAESGLQDAWGHVFGVVVGEVVCGLYDEVEVGIVVVFEDFGDVYLEALESRLNWLVMVCARWCSRW